MFYDKFIQLCELHNKKPTPLLNELQISSTNLKRWKNGSSVSFDTIKVLSDYFDVPISFFLMKMTNRLLSTSNRAIR